MAAMDVVDTLRHQQGIADRELDGEGRRERLLKRLRELYSAQGIEVSDAVLMEGIDALEQERFVYQATPANWQTKLAHLWVSRTRWGKPIGFITLLGALFYGIYFVTDVLPENQLRNQLPEQIQAINQQIEAVAKNPEVVNSAQERTEIALRALELDDLEQSQKITQELQELLAQLERTYLIRVILRRGEMSALWRVSELNEAGRNYYLIVEAVDQNNQVVSLSVLNEETNKRKKVTTWGLRVNEETFLRIAADKKDDGIIQANKIGEKKRGYLKPTFSVATTGGTITEW